MSESRVALVTGSAQGIGFAISIRLAEDGFDVSISDLPSQRQKLEALAEQIRAKGRRALVAIADVTSEKEVDDMVAETKSKLGSVDVLVANAGIAILAPLLETTTEMATKVLLTNVQGTLLCYKAAARVMIEQKRGGRIIGACSIAGKKGDWLYGIYSASKFSVRGLTQVAAREWGRYGITVNCYAPGFTDTAMLHSMEKVADSYVRGQKPGTYVKKVIRQSSLQRLGKPEDIARVVSFLASKDSSYVTGQSLVVDGGTWFD
ncbi:NAD-binding protein [Crucibulum laeve]|uniref:NAD-binding protein n=1 Tax=Crucibulum laeve TaxID=68775 RepID=A0A5C3LGD9_9AGAR|nr:NAD-binding protein [Crucibulum laeve]